MRVFKVLLIKNLVISSTQVAMIHARNATTEWNAGTELTRATRRDWDWPCALHALLTPEHKVSMPHSHLALQISPSLYVCHPEYACNRQPIHMSACYRLLTLTIGTILWKPVKKPYSNKSHRRFCHRVKTQCQQAPHRRHWGIKSPERDSPWARCVPV